MPIIGGNQKASKGYHESEAAVSHSTFVNVFNKYLKESLGQKKKVGRPPALSLQIVICC
jgi:hypothetical protein